MAGRGKGGKGKLMGNVFVPEDIQEMLASKVNITPCCSSFILYLMFICEHGPCKINKSENDD